MTCLFELTHAEFNYLVLLAMKRGFVRSAAQTPWTEREKKQAVKFAMQQLIEESKGAAHGI